MRAGLNLQCFDLEQEGLHPVAVWVNPRTMQRMRRELLEGPWRDGQPGLWWRGLPVHVDINIPNEGYVQGDGMRQIYKDWWAEAGISDEGKSLGPEWDSLFK